MSQLYQVVKWPIFALVALLGLFYWLLDMLQDAVRACQDIWEAGKSVEDDQHPLDCTRDPDLGSHDIIQVNGIKIHYVAAGSEKKPLMVLVHGFPEFWYSWRYQIKEFKKDYRVVAIDQRGYGQSSTPESVSSYDLTELALDIKCIVKSLGYRNCVLVGHDWGGIVCWRVAQAHPEVVDKLIIMNSISTHAFQSLIMNGFAQLKKFWYIFFFFQTPWIPELLLHLFNFYSLDILFLHDPVGKKGKMTPTDLKAYKHTFKQSGMKGPVNYYCRFLRRVPAPVDYTKVSAPTLIIWGDQDPYLETRLAKISSELSTEGGATISLVEGGGHFIQTEEPEVVNELMRKFLS